MSIHFTPVRNPIEASSAAHEGGYGWGALVPLAWRTRRVADAVDGALSVDYWKSAPYFLNFIEGYQLGARLKSALDDPEQRAELRSVLRKAQRLDAGRVRRYEPIDLANAKLRMLAEQTVARWWSLLWMPASMPYYAPAGPWSAPGVADGFTKRIIFSSWAAAPTAIAALLSYEAERLAAGDTAENTPESRRRLASRLDFRLTDRRPAAMTTLALFWPMPAIAEATDPLRIARRDPDKIATLDDMLRDATDAVRPLVGSGGQSRTSTAEAAYWSAPLQADTDLERLAKDHPVGSFVDALAGSAATDEDDTHDPTALTAHVELALETIRSSAPPAEQPADLAETVAVLGLASPGNVAWRAFSRVIAGSEVTPLGHWRAAAVLASGFRTLFNRPDSTFVLDALPGAEPYWRKVLRYCAEGGLQAVMDEFVHHLAEDVRGRSLDDEKLLQLAESARAAIALRPATYRAFDPLHPGSKGIPFLSRFALRYGTLRQKDEDARLPELRSAFNSPFRPFVLASTSIGQEGVDFHWWCHAIVHWNTPPNPVDFEQREGRITRYKGHAIRRNVASKHRADALRSSHPDPWAAAFDAAAHARPSGQNELFPYWVYPGPAAIERHVPHLPLSRDAQRYLQVRDTLTLYRLAFGQPRQEDLLALLRRGQVPTTPEGYTGLIDLRPICDIGEPQVSGPRSMTELGPVVAYE